MRKLRHTFSRLIPHLKTGKGLAPFICRERGVKMMVFSILNGEMLNMSVGANQVVENVMKLQNEGIPVNVVSKSIFTEIEKAFEHIRENEFRRYAPKRPFEDLSEELDDLKKDIEKLFNEKYT